MTSFVREFFQNLMKKKGLLVHSIFLIIMFTRGLRQKYFVEIAVHTEVIEVSLQTSSKIIILKFLSRKMDPQQITLLNDILHFAFQ